MEGKVRCHMRAVKFVVVRLIDILGNDITKTPTVEIKMDETSVMLSGVGWFAKRTIPRSRSTP